MEDGTRKSRYRQLNDHFQACAELAEDQRNAYLSRLGDADPALRKELLGLLQFHDGAVEAPTPPPLADTAPLRASTRTRLLKRRFSFPAAVLAFGGAAALAVLAVQTWAEGRLETHLRTTTGQTLRAALDLRISNLRAWAGRQKEHARKVFDDPALQADVLALAEAAKDPERLKERLLASPAFARVSERLRRVSPDLAGRGFVVITPAGVDVCAESDDIVGRVVSGAGAGYLRRANLGEWIVSRPYPDRLYAQGVAPDYGNPVMFVGGPIPDGSGGVAGMGVLRFTPDPFFETFASATAEFLAFDEKNLLLTRPRDGEALRAWGLIPTSDGFYQIRLRDPGATLGTGRPPAGSPDTWAPTLMSRSALQGHDGIDTAGHRDFRGRTVLAAWSWLPEWEMGVGCQLPLEQVLAPMAPVRTAFRILLALALLMPGLMLAGVRVFRLGRRAGAHSPFGAYVVERPIGKGGMAEVFLARHAVLRRPAALKILAHKSPDPAAVERFEREARLAGRLAHPNTIQIFDFGETPDGRLFYAMEYVKGLNLAQLLAIEGPLPVGRAVFLLAQIAGSLEEAHQLGLLHRDLKPSNIMVCLRGGIADLAKVLDFGIATMASGVDDVTRSSTVVGTPAFLAPERIRSPQLLDRRSDIYAFGAVAFHLLTGRHVFEGATPTELLYQVMSAPRPSASRLRGTPLPAALEALIAACLAVDPDDRPASFPDVLTALKGLEAVDPWTQDDARRWWATNRDRIAGFLEAAQG